MLNCKSLMIQRLRLAINSNLCKFNSGLNIYQSKHFYDVKTKNDTIFAPANPSSSNPKGSPLGVIRISGPQTRNIISRFTKLNPVIETTIDYSNNVIEPRKVRLTKISCPGDKTDVIDIGLVIWFPKPKSYTGEDVCEFHLHGSQAIIKKVLVQLGDLDDVRPAEPGEFTKRAVLNKKMSLMQAESLPDLIASKTDKQRRLALRGLEGFVVKRYENWCEELVNILAHLEASIDFGEDELIGEVKVVNECIFKLKELSHHLETYINLQTRSSNYIRNGFKIAIMGRPNVGKSTLMNKLCQRERSIVSDICGTTRDVIEQSFELGGHSLTLCDTAGLRDFGYHDLTIDDSSKYHNDLIEQEGMKRALVEGSKADVIIFVIDVEDLLRSEVVSNDLSDDISKLLIKLKPSSSDQSERRLLHLIVNKIDLEKSVIDKGYVLLQKLEKSILSKLNQPSANLNYSIVSSLISCKTDQNFDQLINDLSQQLDFMASCSESGVKSGSTAMEFVNERHLAFLRSCYRNVHEASKMDLASIDLMAQHVRDATDYMSRCLGTVSNEQVLDVIFRDFCIGK